MKALPRITVAIVVTGIIVIQPVSAQREMCYNHLGEIISCDEDGSAPQVKTPEQMEVIAKTLSAQDVRENMARLEYTPCSRVFTYMLHANVGNSAYDTRIMLQGLGWGDFFDIGMYGGLGQDEEIDNLLDNVTDWGPGDLIMIDLSTSGWVWDLDAQTVADLDDLADLGVWIVVVGEFYGFLGAGGADNIDNLPVSWVYDRSISVLQEPDSSYWLSPWDDDVWFYGTWASTHPEVAGPFLATGNVWSSGSQATTIARRATDGPGSPYAMFVEEGFWRGFMDSSGVGDLAWLYYGGGTAGSILQQQRIWSCQSHPGTPTATTVTSTSASGSSGIPSFWLFLPVLLTIALVARIWHRKS